MEYIVHDPKTNKYEIFHSFDRLRRVKGLKKDEINKDQLPVGTSKGLIIAVEPDTKL